MDWSYLLEWVQFSWLANSAGSDLPFLWFSLEFVPPNGFVGPLGERTLFLRSLSLGPMPIWYLLRCGPLWLFSERLCFQFSFPNLGPSQWQLCCRITDFMTYLARTVLYMVPHPPNSLGSIIRHSNMTQPLDWRQCEWGHLLWENLVGYSTWHVPCASTMAPVTLCWSPSWH